MANTIGEKELKTNWDALTASDPTKAVGHEQTLVPTEKSLTRKYGNQGAGID
jgi:hypothetical protein